MQPKYSIIIATRNEEESIGKVIRSVPRAIAKDSELIIVDSSEDRTPIIAKDLGAKVIKEKRKGKGRAMRTGVEKSGGDILIFLDGDGTDPPEYIPKILKELKRSNLVLACKGMKSFKNDDFMMRNYFRFDLPIMRLLFRIGGFDGVTDPLAGFRAIRRKDWNKLNLKSNAFEIETEMDFKAMKSGFVIREIAIPHLKRGGGFKNSKFMNDPKAWFKVINAVMKYKDI
jgi:glycosyltransferase involved in cell wall biosynthesis